jgi:hypothetical protein
MNDHSHEHHAVLDAIAAWIKKYREAIGTQNELANCTPEQVAAIARDMGLSPGELRFMAAKGPHAADELPKLLRALGVDPQQLASKDPGKMRDLQRICVTCAHKGRCQHDLADVKPLMGETMPAESLRLFCPQPPAACAPA